MPNKPTYKELEQRVKELEKNAVERGHVETALRESEATLKSIFRAAPTGIGMVQDRVIKKANDRLCEMLGYSSEELVGKSARILYPTDEDYEYVGKEKYDLIRKQGTGTVETRWQCKDGKIINILLSSTPIDSQDLSAGVTFTALDITRRKQAEEALRDSERKYATLVESSKDGIIMICDGLLNFVNRASIELVGRSPDEMIGANFLEFVADDYRELVLKRYTDRINGKDVPPIYDIELLRRDGRTIPVELNAIRIDFEDKPADLVVIRDISERKNVEKALRESENRYRLLADNVTDVIWIRDINLGLTYISPSVTDQLGYTVEEAKALTLEENWTPDSFKLIKQVLIDELELENKEKTDLSRSQTIEVEAKCKDGSTKWVEAKMNFLRDQDGQPIGIIGVARDVSERRRAEAALKESEEKYRTVLEANPDPVIVYDIEGKVIYFNPAFTRVFGWKLDERLDKKMDVFVPEDAWPETQKMIKKVLAGERFSSVETRRYTKRGNLIPVSVSGAIYKDQDGSPLGSVINLRDISEQKKLEAQLHQAQKMEAIGTLAGGITHDFNNLLMGIQGRTSLMLMGIDSSHPHSEHLKGIENYVISAADLIKQLLGFARSGKYEVKTINLNDLIKRENQMFGRTKKEVNIHEKFEKDLWSIDADQGQIEQVLLNMHVNAWQAMPGGGNLYVQTENVIIDKDFVKPHHVEPGKFVKVSITDTGVGMDKATQQRIFDPFFTTKEMGRGTGLGLASSYGIIKNHGGFIDVYSAKGEGATFNIYLPASAKKVLKEKRLKKEILRGTETVLLVDDEEIITSVGKELLSNLGYNVLIAKNGKEAIQTYQENHKQIDIVILDMILPEMGGGKIYDALKEINPDMKVVLSSGYSIDGEATEIMERGCDGFLQKPFKIGELSRKLREVLMLK